MVLGDIYVYIDPGAKTGFAPRRRCLRDLKDVANCTRRGVLAHYAWYLRVPGPGDATAILHRGCVTFRLNGIDGPCVRFPGVEWRSGVQVLVEEWPSPAVIDRDLPRVAVSCATPPPPPSLLVAAEEPMTVEEHLATGSLESLE